MRFANGPNLHSPHQRFCHPRLTVGSFEILKGNEMSRFTKSNDNAATEMKAVSRSAKTAKIITPNPKQLVREFLGDFCAWPTSG